MKYVTYAKYGLVALLILLAAYGFYTIWNSFSPSKGSEFRLSKTTVIKELRDLNRLETAAFTIEKVIDSGDSGNAFQNLLFGDRILLIAHGEVVAGIDLAKLSDKDVFINNNDLKITLPAPEILTTTLDNQQTRVYDRRKGLLAAEDKDLESRARLEAQKAITQAACDGKILDSASDNARKQLTTLFKALGFTNIIIDIPQGNC